MLVVLDRDGSDGNEEDSSDEVDEELQDGEVGAQQVGHQHRRHDDGVPVYRNTYVPYCVHCTVQWSVGK